MNKQELLEAHAQLLAKADELKQAAADMEDKINQLETEDQMWKPWDNNNMYYFITDSVQRGVTEYDGCNSFDTARVDNYNYFKTKEEAERHALRVKAINELHKVADYLNDGWQPDWTNEDQEKWCIYYNHYSSSFKITGRYLVARSSIQYKSEELAEKAITMLSDNAKAYIKGEL